MRVQTTIDVFFNFKVMEGEILNILFIAGTMLLISVVSSKVLYKYGVPVLVIFLGMGMLMGSDGIGGIYFNNPLIAEQLSNVGLLFIMFSGGFETNWKTAKPVALASTVLASVGVFFTAFLIGVFAYFVLGFSFLEGMLLGSIISSTDAASVFSILRSKNLNLKNNIAPMLEMESGSNDPMAYMLTTIFISLILGKSESIFLLLTSQILIGIAVGVVVGRLGVWIINNIKLDIDGLYYIIVMAIALISMSSANLINGNGFLAVYITGLIIGNSRIIHKINLVKYFDGISWLMQIMLFFTLGLLVFPSQLPGIAVKGLITAAFIIFIARPVTVFIILSFFKKSTKDKLLVSWVGFRGAAAIVFATYPLTQGLPIANEIFNIVFFIALVSVLVQGSFFIPIAKKLDLISEEETTLKTFTDYSGDIYADLLEVEIPRGNNLKEKAIMDLDIPDDVLIVIIKRNNKLITPRGTTMIKEGDTLMISGDEQSLMKIDSMSKEILLT